jgi:hypothetical protein
MKGGQSHMNKPDTNNPDREQAIQFGILPEENVLHWAMIEEGRYQPRRKRGSLRGRELG